MMDSVVVKLDERLGKILRLLCFFVYFLHSSAVLSKSGGSFLHDTCKVLSTSGYFAISMPTSIYIPLHRQNRSTRCRCACVCACACAYSSATLLRGAGMLGCWDACR
jgi:hypothetical protein